MAVTDLSGCSALDGTTRTQTLEAYSKAPIWGFTVLPSFDVGLVLVVGFPVDSGDEVGSITSYRAYPVGCCVSCTGARSANRVEFSILRFGKCAKNVVHHDFTINLDVKNFRWELCLK